MYSDVFAVFLAGDVEMEPKKQKLDSDVAATV